MYRVVPSCLLIVLFFPAVRATEQEKTYCDDSSEWTAWEQRAARNAGNLDMVSASISDAAPLKLLLGIGNSELVTYALSLVTRSSLLARSPEK